MTREIAEDLAASVDVPGTTLLKRIDEYNLSLHTKKWIGWSDMRWCRSRPPRWRSTSRG
jgi:hypothetical protein